MKSVRSSVRSALSRAAETAIVALWCLLSLVSGASQALCLDLSGGCASPTAALATCHAQIPEGSLDPGCGSCVDVLLPEDASAGSCRPDSDLGAPEASQAHLVAGETRLAEGATGAAVVPPPIEASPLHHSVRTTVLLI